MLLQKFPFANIVNPDQMLNSGVSESILFA